MSLTSCLTNEMHPWMSCLLVLEEKVLTCVTYLQNREISGLASVNLILTCRLSSWFAMGTWGPDLALTFSVAVICFCSLFSMTAMKANLTFITSRHIALSITSTHLKVLLDILQQMFIHWKMHKQLSCRKGFMENILNTYTSAFQIKLI